MFRPLAPTVSIASSPILVQPFHLIQAPHLFEHPHVSSLPISRWLQYYYYSVKVCLVERGGIIKDASEACLRK